MVSAPLIVAAGFLMTSLIFLLKKSIEQEQEQNHNWEIIAQNLGFEIDYLNGLPHLHGQYNEHFIDLRVYKDAPTTIEFSLQNPSQLRFYLAHKGRMSLIFAPQNLESILFGIEELDNKFFVLANDTDLIQPIISSDITKINLTRMHLCNIFLEKNVLTFENLDWPNVEKIVDTEYWIFVFSLLNIMANDIDKI